MKKQLLAAIMYLPVLFGVSTVRSQCALVEAPGVESQDILRVSNVNGTLMFFGREEGGSIYDVYLWTNNGTSSTKIKLMYSVTSGINASYITPCNGKGIFFTSDGTNGYEPWVTDGTAAGTFMLKNINPSGNSVSVTQECFCYNNKFYFAAADGTNGSELWVTDGTSAGTVMLKDIKPGSGSGNPQGFVQYNNDVYFFGISTFWKELWHTDGTAAGTVKMTNPSGLSQLNSGPFVHNGLIYFGGTNGSSVNGLYKTDGTTANTSLVTASITPNNAVSLGTDMIFSYSFVDASCFCWRYQLFKTNGITTTLVKDSVNVISPVVMGSKVVFGGEYTGSNSGYEPWVTDGTTAGTYSLASASTGSASSYYGLYRSVSPVFNNKVYFTSDQGLWETDGTILGTMQTCDIRPGATDNIFDFTINGADLYFYASNPANGNRSELYKLGGSTGIKNNGEYVHMNLYPQPASDIVTITLDSEFEKAELILSDISGKEIKRESVTVVNNRTQLRLDNVVSGIYFLTIKTPAYQHTGKIVVNK